MILEEFAKTDAIFLDLSLKLKHKISDFLLTNKCSLFTNILILLCLVKFLHLLLEGLEWCAVINELKVLNFIVIGAIN